MDKNLKIAVFGDSYGARAFTGHADHLSWPEMLAQDGYNITSYCENGSSLDFAYMTFLQQYKQYDVVIFLATYPDRILLPPTVPDFTGNDRHLAPTTVDSKEQLTQKFISDQRYMSDNAPQLREYLRILNAAKEYFAHLHWMHLAIEKGNAILARVKKLAPNSLILSNNNCYYEELDNPLELSQLTRLEYANVAVPEWPDPLHCHMTQTNNRIFASKIAEWLETGVLSVSTDDFVFLTADK